MRYRKVSVQIWNDEKFRSLSPGAKLIFLAMLTHPNMTGIGAMRASMAGLAAELDWPMDSPKESLSKGYAIPFREGFREVCLKGMARHDESACLVALPNFLKHNPPENPNVVKGWVSCLDVLPECDLLRQCFQWVERVCQTLPKGYAESLPEPFRKGMPNQEQRTESREQEQRSPYLRPEPDKPASGREERVAPDSEGIESASPEREPEPAEAPVMVFPVIGQGPREWTLTSAKLAEYTETFPGVDVLAHCRIARQWCVDNPAKRKTAKGMAKFLGGWIERNQNRGSANGRGSPARNGRHAAGADSMERWAQDMEAQIAQSDAEIEARIAANAPPIPEERFNGF